ncbi:hypothetical protein [Niabella sp.]|uniref:hypothetical protein n=1 Tax=Niabella sp. TaxID=1962976 RepID=UPI002616C55F|nr:hypothetical protein [Niabella sp.]
MQFEDTIRNCPFPNFGVGCFAVVVNNKMHKKSRLFTKNRGFEPVMPKEMHILNLADALSIKTGRASFENLKCVMPCELKYIYFHALIDHIK